MDAALRRRFNAAYSPARYERYRNELARRAGAAAGFRLAETPTFLPNDFRERCERAANEIVAQLSEPARIARMRAALPARWTFANETPLPSFAVVDFAAVRAADGSYEPKLVELQGFPSLFAFEVAQSDAWYAALDGAGFGELTCWFGGRDRSAYLDVLRRTIVADNDPGDVVLLDIEPQQQKTYCDFRATQLLFGVDPVDPRELVRRGRSLYRRDARGRERRVGRIYYRLITDELEWRAMTLPFDPRDELDLEWAPHPNWFFIWSKSSLPYLDHPSVPRTTLLADLPAVPDDLEERYVLKPLFSFAGVGVNVAPTRADLAAIPAYARDAWCLQERIDYGPAIEAADGGTVKVEIRMMFLRPDGTPTLQLATNLCRLSRGAMLGVDYNKDKTWVGSSIGVWER